MANKFSMLAQSVKAKAPIMIGREKLSTRDIIEKELTVIGIDFAEKFDKKTGEKVVDPETGEIESYGVVIFEELPGYYYTVGTMFTKVCKAIYAGYSSAEECSRELKEEGGIKVKFYWNNGDSNSYVNYDILN